MWSVSRERPNSAGVWIRAVMNSAKITENRHRSPAMKNQMPSSPARRARRSPSTCSLPAPLDDAGKAAASAGGRDGAAGSGFDMGRRVAPHRLRQARDLLLLRSRLGLQPIDGVEDPDGHEHDPEEPQEELDPEVDQTLAGEGPRLEERKEQ